MTVWLALGLPGWYFLILIRQKIYIKWRTEFCSLSEEILRSCFWFHESKNDSGVSIYDRHLIKNGISLNGIWCKSSKRNPIGKSNRTIQPETPMGKSNRTIQPRKLTGQSSRKNSDGQSNRTIQPPTAIHCAEIKLGFPTHPLLGQFGDDSGNALVDVCDHGPLGRQEGHHTNHRELGSSPGPSGV